MSGEYDWGVDNMVEDWDYVEDVFYKLRKELEIEYEDICWEVMSYDEVLYKCDEIGFNNECVEDLRFYCDELIYIEEW